MIAQIFRLEELKKAVASNLTFEVHRRACTHARHTVYIIIQLPCMKCTLFNPEMYFLYFIKLDLF